MKPLLVFWLWCLCSPFLWAQIQIEMADVVVEEAEAADAENAEGVEAPESRDHGSGDAAKGPESDRLFLLNDDRVSGELVRMDAETGVTWAHPDVEGPVVFGLENLGYVEFSGSFAGDPLESLTRVELTNGDAYRGTVVRMTAEELVLDTPYAGEITLAPSMVRKLEPRSGSLALYEGPGGADEWIVNKNHGQGHWKYRKGALYSDNHNQVAGLALDDFPDKASIEFDLAWRGNPQIHIVVWSQSTTDANEDGYAVMLQNSYVRCYRYSNQRGRQDLGNSHFDMLRQINQARVRLLLNRKEKEIMLFLNGEMVKTWRDQVDGKIVGDAVLLQSSTNSPMKVENMVIREWDGELTQSEDKAAGDQDLLMLTNGDKFSGSLLGIEAGLFRFKNDFADFEVPVDRVDRVNLAPDTRMEPRLNAGDARVRFPTGEEVTLKVGVVGDGVLTGSAEATGEVTLRTEFVTRLTFNPYDERHEKDEDTW